ncbi:helix-turn-helix transcriptional regulator [Sphingosinicella rhizophila]|uniref:helix-turn-helix transcriptional regulator n=1 Tax=Sphingosinicella rhizophila TaxID=3050082 RepID=UPI0039656ECC
MIDEDALLTLPEVAKLLNVPTSRLYKGRVSGTGVPPAIKLGRLIRFRRGDVRAWLEAQPSTSSTSDVA